MLTEFEVKPALCLDFDGTIRYGKNGKFINHLEDIALFEDVEPILWDYREQGFLILGMTNQGGLAYGYKSLQQVQDEIDATLALFSRNPFHHVQYSVLHPEGRKTPFNLRTLLRKPEIGMLAVSEAQMFQQGIIIDWDKSIFVGDRFEDEECAQKAGIRFEWANAFFGREAPKKTD